MSHISIFNECAQNNIFQEIWEGYYNFVLLGLQVTGYMLSLSWEFDKHVREKITFEFVGQSVMQKGNLMVLYKDTVFH